MVLVFILLALFIIILTFLFLILLSTFNIKVKDLELTNIKEEKVLDYTIILSLYLFNKLKWISIHLNDEKLRKMYSKMQLEKIDIKKLEQDFKWEDLKVIKEIQPKISYLNLNAMLGTESPTITAFLVAILSSIISISLPYSATQIKRENYKYTIQPVYRNQNIYKIQFNCIIQVKMVHIINVVYIFLKKRRSDFNGRTASNRGTYGYSHE